MKVNNVELLREAIAKCQAISKEIDGGIDRLNKGNELLEKLVNDMDREIDRIKLEIRPFNFNTK